MGHQEMLRQTRPKIRLVCYHDVDVVEWSFRDVDAVPGEVPRDRQPPGHEERPARLSRELR